MSNNRTYKKLGELATFSRGLTFSKADVADVSSKKVLRSNNIDLNSHSLNYGDVACLNETFVIPDEKKLHKGDIFICMSNGSTQHLGKVAFIEDDIDYAFGGFMGAIHPNVKLVYPKYVFYSCLSTEYRRYLASVLNGVNINNLKWSELSNFSIPVPPLATQSQIVSELDLLQSLIDKQKAQLKELDNLAQAFFYDMFGDPVENEKGWEVKDLGDLCEVYRGGSPRPIERFLGGTIPWIKIGDATKGDDIYLHQTKEHIIEEGLKKTRYIHAGSLIFANCGVSLGFARIITFDGCIHDGWLAFDNVSKSIEKVFLLKSLNFCTSYFRSIAPDGTQPNLNTAIMKSFKQILPPLPMQKLYIAKIESIEKQKAAISKSIEETQKLFDYTMDKYFG